MQNQVEVEDGKLKIDLQTIADALPPDDRLDLLIKTTMDDFLIEAIVRLVTTEHGYWTEDGNYSFSQQFAAKIRGQLWKRIEANIPKIVRQRVRDLLNDVVEAKHYRELAEKSKQVIEGAWRRSCPYCEKYLDAPPQGPAWTPFERATDEEVERVVDVKEA